MTTSEKILLAAAFFVPALPAMAQQAGTWSASLGATRIVPSVDSGVLSDPSGAPGSTNGRVGVSADTRVTGAIGYAVTDHLNLHVPIGLGFRHDILGAGALAGLGKLADTRVLPVTAVAQYRFMDANARVRPYVGAGLSYIRFYKEQGSALLTALTNPGGPPTGVTFKSKLAPVLQLGAVFNIDAKWFVETSYTKTFLKTRGTLSTNQTIDVGLDPDCFTFQVGYRF